MSLASLGIFFFGYLGAKLVGLEMMVVYQIAFLSMLGLDNLTPIANGLKGL
jgi:hypothetical protein